MAEVKVPEHLGRGGVAAGSTSLPRRERHPQGPAVQRWETELRPGQRPWGRHAGRVWLRGLCWPQVRPPAWLGRHATEVANPGSTTPEGGPRHVSPKAQRLGEPSGEWEAMLNPASVCLSGTDTLPPSRSPFLAKSLASARWCCCLGCEQKSRERRVCGAGAGTSQRPWGPSIAGSRPAVGLGWRTREEAASLGASVGTHLFP